MSAALHVRAASRTRPARAEDLEAMFQCFRTTMRVHVEPAFGWDDDFQRNGFMAQAGVAESTVFTVADTFAGFSWLERGDEWFLRLICIQPEFQNQRIAGEWMRALLQEATPSGRHVRLKVFKTNRAKCLYERLGLRVVDTSLHTWDMIFDAVAANSP